MNIERIKNFIIKVFHIKTYEKEFYKLSELNRKNTELYESLVSSYKKDLELANARIAELEKLCEEPLTAIEDIERAKHKAYADGRRHAYADMGIKALNAKVDGNVICVDEEGKVIEVITTPTLEEVCESEGIDINELENIS